MIELTTSYQLIKQEYVGNAYGDVYLKCYAKYDERDITNNRTKISVATNLYTAGTWWGQNGQRWYAGATGLTTAEGQAPDNYGAGQEVTLGVLSGWINHSSDGTKEITVSSGFISTPWGFNKTIGDGVKLPDIPRASTLNSASISVANNGNISLTSNFTKYVSSFYQSIRIVSAYNSTILATINGVTSGTTYNLDNTQKNAIYNYLGTKTSDNVDIVLVTYTSSGGTTVGSSLKTIKITLPNYSLSLTATVADSVTTYDTYKPNTNTFIANLSKPTYTFSASSSTGTTYGRSIGYLIGSTSVTSPYTNNNYTGQSLTITASDGRKSTTSTPLMTHVPYFKPTLTTKVERPTPTGSTATVNVSGTLYKGTGLTNLLTPSLKFKYTESGGTEQEITIPLTLTDSGDVTSFTGTTTLSGLNYKRTINWNSTLTDRINIVANNNGVLPEGLPLWNGYKRNDENYFNVNGNIIGDSYNDYKLDLLTEEKQATWFPVITYSSQNGYTIKHRSLLANLLQLSMLYTTTGEEQVSDNQTKKYQLERGGFYLFIDSHPYNNTIGVINGFNGGVNYLLQVSSGHLTFTYNTTNYQMTVRTVNGARFKIYKIEGQSYV